MKNNTKAVELFNKINADVEENLKKLQSEILASDNIDEVDAKELFEIAFNFRSAFEVLKSWRK